MTKASREEITIDNCAQEQIHIPGSIQSFGYLLAFDENSNITRASENIERITGKSAAKLFSNKLTELHKIETAFKIETAKYLAEIVGTSLTSH